VSSPDEWLALIRWRNAALAAAGVCAAAWWSAGVLTSRVGFAAAAAVALTAVANTTNDLADIEIDRAAHPRRPLPSGAIAARAATRFAVGSSVIALALTALIDYWLSLLTVAVLVLMWMYSARLKRHGIPGNVTVAVLGSLPFLYGAWAVGELEKGALLVFVAAPLHFAREVAKDLDDARADAGARRTLPLTGGVATARATVAGAVVAYSVAVLLLAVAHPLFATLLVPTILLAGLAVRRLYRDHDGTAKLLKVAMVIAVAALVISGG
jgi:geranylgeranylglycerol-phosphate geranylgeranyltransferase